MKLAIGLALLGVAYVGFVVYDTLAHWQEEL